MKEIFRVAAAAVGLASLVSTSAFADERVLILSAYPTEGAVLLQHAQPATQIGVFNGRRFFAGNIEGHDVVLGLVGIGMVNAERTTQAALDYFAKSGAAPKAIIFSGVAGGPNIGDVVVPDRWTTDGMEEYEVDARMFRVAKRLEIVLNPYLPIEDATCAGLRLGNTPIRLTADPVLRFGGLGVTGDPYGERAVPCFSHAGDLIGCEACGAPLNTSPDVAKFLTEASTFADPQFFIDLMSSFSGGGSVDGVVGDMETAPVARLANANDIPFLAFRAVSDGGGDPNPITAAIGFPVQFAVYEQLAADNAAAVVIEFLKSWKR